VDLDEEKDESPDVNEINARYLSRVMMCDKELLSKFKIGLQTDYEDRICDESTFVISLL
jgi:hypothetical protein